jgi:NADH:ubiquinone oxidoreductase subunit F (NADH-binding)
MPGHLLPAAPLRTLEAYLQEGGGRGLERAVELGPAATIEEVSRSGLRGRGGAGFPTGRKWATVAAQRAERRYLVANGAEGEPATFKDRALLRANPYQLVEGLVIAAFAVGVDGVYVALKAQFAEEAERLTAAIQEMQSAGICRDCEITIALGPDEYLFGEEKALLEVIEGKSPLPRLFPPYEHGLFATDVHSGWEGSGTSAVRLPSGGANPTVVNNVETLSNVPHILARGADWFRSLGTEGSPGTVVATVVGDVVRPGVGEVELGTPLRDVIEGVGGGTTPGRRVKAVFSGVANAVLTEASLDLPLDHAAFEAAGSGLGAAGFMVFDDTACMVEIARMISRFLYIESCGQCPACKRGSEEITAALERVEAGAADERTIGDLAGWLRKVTDGNRCFLAVEEQQVVASVLERFGEEVAEHLAAGRCPRPRPLELPKLVDLRDGIAVYDHDHARKQPDWTYTPA